MDLNGYDTCSASAFVPSGPFVGSRVASVARPASSSLSMVAADMVGASAPLGFFDPMGFSKGPEERLNAYREAELKHGRTAMLAVVGFLTQVSLLFDVFFLVLSFPLARPAFYDTNNTAKLNPH